MPPTLPMLPMLPMLQPVQCSSRFREPAGALVHETIWSIGTRCWRTGWPARSSGYRHGDASSAGLKLRTAQAVDGRRKWDPGQCSQCPSRFTEPAGALVHETSWSIGTRCWRTGWPARSSGYRHGDASSAGLVLRTAQAVDGRRKWDPGQCSQCPSRFTEPAGALRARNQLEHWDQVLENRLAGA